MWCKQCERETNKDKCDICNAVTEPDVPLVIYWCSICKAPIIKYSNDITKDICPEGGQTTEYMCADLRPVFPEEREKILIYDIARFCIYLCKSEKKLNDLYVRCMEYCFEMDLNMASLDSLTETANINIKHFKKTLPPSFVAACIADARTNGSGMSRSIVTVLEGISPLFLTTLRVSEKKSKAYNDYIGLLYRNLDSWENLHKLPKISLEHWQYGETHTLFKNKSENTSA